jgi:hypothetical protein
MNPEQQARRGDRVEWFCILAGPIAWLTQFEINYALVRWECMAHSRTALHVVSFVFLTVVIGVGVVSAVYFARTRRESAASEQLSARRHFMAALGILTSALFALAIIMQTIPGFILDPCQR